MTISIVNKVLAIAKQKENQRRFINFMKGAFFDSLKEIDTWEREQIYIFYLDELVDELNLVEEDFQLVVQNLGLKMEIISYNPIQVEIKIPKWTPKNHKFLSKLMIVDYSQELGKTLIAEKIEMEKMAQRTCREIKRKLKNKEFNESFREESDIITVELDEIYYWILENYYFYQKVKRIMNNKRLHCIEFMEGTYSTMCIIEIREPKKC